MLKNTKKKLRFLLLLAAVAMIVLSVEHLGLFAGVDTYFYDTFLRLRGDRPVSDQIVIVGIDAKTLDTFGKWPLKRRYYVEMLERLGQAAVVGFDLLLMESTEDDAQLTTSIQKHGRVILPEYVSNSLKITKPLERLSPLKTGHVHIELGIDNTAREVFHSLYCNNTLLPSLASVMYETASGGKLFRKKPQLMQPDNYYSGTLFQQDLQKINFYGAPGRFHQISMADVITGAVTKEFFRDKIVLVGLTVPGIVDQVSTPFSQARNRMSGVEVHANIVNNLLDKSFIRDATGWIRSGIVFIVSLVLGVFFLRLSEKNAALLWGFSLFLAAIIAAFLLFTQNLWLSLSVFYVSISLVYVISYLYRLDNAARKLDKEHEVTISLLGWDVDEIPEQTPARGLFGFLSEGGINGKIQRQIRVTTKLLKLNKHLEKALKSQREALDNQVRLVEMLSHEYRTPLAIIRANLDILEMKDDSAGGMLSTNFGKMKRAMSRLVEVMDISLRRERLEDSNAKMDSNEIPLVPFMRTILDEARELWAERRLEFDLEDNRECFVRTILDKKRDLWVERHLEPDLEENGKLVVFGDSSLLKTALLNLIDNAVKYSTEHEPVLISLSVAEGEAIVRVQNHGTVIPAGDLGRVFDKFYRGSRSGNTRGAGLGLYLVRKIIEQQHGSITLVSNESEGTVAIVRMPLEQA
jgi:CHASE2 domain-containing sensor protein/anti-sigma regulatory factor (Ser/Thr protein kinase)